MTGLKAVYTDYLYNYLYIESLFGFYYCDIKTSDNYLGLLVIRTARASVKMANGKWSGGYFSEQLKIAKGYRLTIKEKKKYEYNLDKEYPVFTDFVLGLYNTKAEYNNIVPRNISKSILNNLFERFGMSITKPNTSILKNERLDKRYFTINIRNTTSTCKNSNLTIFTPDHSKDLCEELGVDYIKARVRVLKVKSLTKGIKLSHVNITISGAISYYARIYMAKLGWIYSLKVIHYILRILIV